jgi:hypothetical protein
MTTIINSGTLGLTQQADTSSNLQIQTANIAAMTLDTNQIVTFETTGAINLPAGTTAQRPTVVANGAMRYNTTINSLEGYIAGSWQSIASSFISGYVANVMIVAGAGSGGGLVGGGGGGGGVTTANLMVLSPGTTYSVVVGTGNTAPATTSIRGSAGLNSSFNQITAYGGGSGGTGSSGPAFTGGDGGSGGGNNGQNNYGLYGAYGRGISGQGFAGGFSSVGFTVGCGGGGAGAVGGFNQSTGGTGGVGTLNTIPGSTAGQLVSGVYYVSGGGGGNNNNGTSPGAGGNGGGGAAQPGASNGINGTANTGGGGGGAYNGGVGGNGGSGVVVLSIPTTSYSGNSYVTGSYTYTIFNSFTILGFTSNGSYTA